VSNVRIYVNNELGRIWREKFGTILIVPEKSYEKSQIIIEPNIDFLLVWLW
jgi:hypothetical protein